MLPVAVLAGCQHYEPQSSEAGAEGYYSAKYGGRAQVVESHGLGSYNLFGYTYSGMEYIMDDGSSVVYVDDGGKFRDNRQASQIEEAATDFAEERLASMPGALTEAKIESVGTSIWQETYAGEGTCWRTYFDGDIEKFLSKEWPRLSLERSRSGAGDDGSFGFDVAYDSLQAEDLEDAYLTLGTYFDLRRIELALVDGEEGAAKLAKQELTLYDDELVCVMSFEGDSAGEVVAERYKPAFVELAESISISSATSGVTLREGDVRLVEADGDAMEENLYAGIEGLWTCEFGDEAGRAAKDAGQLSFRIRNESDDSLVAVLGLDSFSTVCGAHASTNYATLTDGELLYVGNEAKIRPWIEILDVSPTRVKARYHTRFKKQIKAIDLRVIGMAYNGKKPSSESVAFEAAVVEDTEDGWLCIVDVREDAVPSNTLYFQFTYNHDEDVSVQIEQPIELPL